MECTVCKEDKTPYNFFLHRYTYNQTFSITTLGFTSSVCFDCGGPYRCVKCGEIHPSTSYRVQGRMCNYCRNAEIRHIVRRDRAVLVT